MANRYLGRISYFSVPSMAAALLPNDPGKIWDLAMNYRNAKNNLKQVKEKVLGKPSMSFMETIDGAVGDIGAGAGLGITMLGAKLNQYKPTQKLGRVLKRHGTNTLTNSDLQTAYGLAIPGTAIVGGTALLGKAALDKIKESNELVPTYLPGYEYNS